MDNSYSEIKELPPAYRNALVALKAQAAAATEMLLGDKASGKQALRQAQQEMALYDAECKKIMRLLFTIPLSDPECTIPTLSEAKLAELLNNI